MYTHACVCEDTGSNGWVLGTEFNEGTVCRAVGIVEGKQERMMNDPGTSDSWKQYLLRQRGKGLGTVLQNPVRVMGVEEGLLNRSCGRRGSIAGDKWY